MATKKKSEGLFGDDPLYPRGGNDINPFIRGPEGKPKGGKDKGGKGHTPEATKKKPNTQEGGLEGTGHDIEGWLMDLTGTGYHKPGDPDYSTGIKGPAEQAAAKAKDKGKKAKTPEPTQAQIDAEEEKAIQNNPWVQAGNALTESDEAGAQAAEQAMGAGPGSLLANVSGQSQAQALADAGVSPGSNAGAWLSSQLSQANANDSPLMNAMNAYQAAYEQTQPSVTQALQNMGQANALATSVAPEQAYLNLLTSHFGNTNYETLTPEQAAGLPPALQYYLGPQGAQVQGVSGKASGAIPSAQNILSGGTSASALTPSFSAAPS